MDEIAVVEEGFILNLLLSLKLATIETNVAGLLAVKRIQIESKTIQSDCVRSKVISEHKWLDPDQLYGR